MKTGNRFTTILAADENTTRHHAEIRLQLASVGTPIPMNDLWIAAIARQRPARPSASPDLFTFQNISPRMK